MRRTDAVRIKQLDVETDEVIEIYSSISQAAWDNFTTPKTIRNALRNGGYVKTRPLKFEVMQEEESYA